MDAYLRLDVGEEHVLLRLRCHADQWALAAQPHASSAAHLDPCVELPGLDFRLEPVDDGRGSGRLAACARTADQAHIKSLLLGVHPQQILLRVLQVS